MTSLPNFPAAELEAFYLGRIQAQCAVLALDATVSPAIRFCHWSPFGHYAIWTGFRVILDEAQIAEAKGEEKSPALIFGMHSPDSIPAIDNTAVLKWPGVKYLRYDVGDTELLDALEGCLVGCLQPLPPHLQPNPQALLRLLALVRHQFEGVRAPIKIRLLHLNRALNGELLPPSQARMSRIFTAEHERDLERLACYLPFSLALAPEIAGLKPYNESLQTFRWQLQDVAELVQLVPEGGSTAALAALEGWQRVKLTVEQIIKSIQSLEQALKQKLEKIK